MFEQNEWADPRNVKRRDRKDENMSLREAFTHERFEKVPHGSPMQLRHKAARE